MAATCNNIKKFALGNTSSLITGVIALDSSYPTGGEAITIADAEYVQYFHAPNLSGYSFEYDRANAKLKVFRGDNANAAAAPSVEVANAVDLSALTDVRFIAIVSGG